jgi:uncharacterized protein
MMESEGHSFFISARDKEIAHILLKKYSIPYYNRGKGYSSLFGKLFYTFVADYRLVREAIKYRADVFLSFGSPYAAHASWLLRKPHIAITDTEHASLGILSFKPFSRYIITSRCFKKSFGKKHFRFNGLIEWAYLSPGYFKADPEIFNILGISTGEKYVVLRFVNWNATHDIGHKGLSSEYKKKFVEEISKYAKVFISSEAPLPEEMEPYRLRIPVDRIHDLLAFAALFAGESGTMSTEAALLGTPAINISTSAVGLGSFEELQSRSLMFVTPENQKALDKAIELIEMADSKSHFRKHLESIMTEYEDINDYLIAFLKTIQNE